MTEENRRVIIIELPTHMRNLKETLFRYYETSPFLDILDVFISGFSNVYDQETERKYSLLEISELLGSASFDLEINEDVLKYIGANFDFIENELLKTLSNYSIDYKSAYPAKVLGNSLFIETKKK